MDDEDPAAPLRPFQDQLLGDCVVGMVIDLDHSPACLGDIFSEEVKDVFWRIVAQVVDARARHIVGKTRLEGAEK